MILSWRACWVFCSAVSNNINPIVSFISTICWSWFLWGQSSKKQKKFSRFNSFFSTKCGKFFIQIDSPKNDLALTFRFWIFFRRKMLWGNRTKKHNYVFKNNYTLLIPFSLKKWCFTNLTNTWMYNQHERLYYSSLPRKICSMRFSF